MCIKSRVLKEILKFVAPVMHLHFCQKYKCLGAKHVVLHRPSVHFGLGTVSKVPCGNALPGADPGFLKGGGGPGADTGFFTSTPPPWTLSA